MDAGMEGNLVYPFDRWFNMNAYWQGEHNLDNIISNFSKAQRKKLSDGVFGDFLKLQSYKTSMRLLHCLLLSRIVSSDPNRLSFNIFGHVIHFGPEEYHVYTGLRFSANREELFDGPAINMNQRLLKQYFRGKSNLQVSDVRKFLVSMTPASLVDEDDAVKIAEFYIFQSIILCSNKKTSLVEVHYLDIINNEDLCRAYPWGSAGFEALVNSAMRPLKSGVNYYVLGFPFVLCAWFLDLFPSLRSNFCTYNGRGFPRMVRFISFKNPQYNTLVDQYFHNVNSFDKFKMVPIVLSEEEKRSVELNVTEAGPVVPVVACKLLKGKEVVQDSEDTSDDFEVCGAQTYHDGAESEDIAETKTEDGSESEHTAESEDGSETEEGGGGTEDGADESGDVGAQTEDDDDVSGDVGAQTEDDDDVGEDDDDVGEDDVAETEDDIHAGEAACDDRQDARHGVELDEDLVNVIVNKVNIKFRKRMRSQRRRIRKYIGGVENKVRCVDNKVDCVLDFMKKFAKNFEEKEASWRKDVSGRRSKEQSGSVRNSLNLYSCGGNASDGRKRKSPPDVRKDFSHGAVSGKDVSGRRSKEQSGSVRNSLNLYSCGGNASDGRKRKSPPDVRKDFSHGAVSGKSKSPSDDRQDSSEGSVVRKSKSCSDVIKEVSGGGAGLNSAIQLHGALQGAFVNETPRQIHERIDSELDMFGELTAAQKEVLEIQLQCISGELDLSTPRLLPQDMIVEKSGTTSPPIQPKTYERKRKKLKKNSSHPDMPSFNILPPSQESVSGGSCDAEDTPRVEEIQQDMSKNQQQVELGKEQGIILQQERTDDVEMYNVDVSYQAGREEPEGQSVNKTVEEEVISHGKEMPVDVVMENADRSNQVERDGDMTEDQQALGCQSIDEAPKEEIMTQEQEMPSKIVMENPQAIEETRTEVDLTEPLTFESLVDKQQSVGIAGKEAVMTQEQEKEELNKEQQADRRNQVEKDGEMTEDQQALGCQSIDEEPKEEITIQQQEMPLKIVMETPQAIEQTRREVDLTEPQTFESLVDKQQSVGVTGKEEVMTQEQEKEELNKEQQADRSNQVKRHGEKTEDQQTIDEAPKEEVTSQEHERPAPIVRAIAKASDQAPESTKVEQVEQQGLLGKRDRKPSQWLLSPYNTTRTKKKTTDWKGNYRRICPFHHLKISPAVLDEFKSFLLFQRNGTELDENNHACYIRGNDYDSNPYQLEEMKPDKQWFLEFVYVDYTLSDNHIDVAMYYLRKRACYHLFQFPHTLSITDLVFDSYMCSIYKSEFKDKKKRPGDEIWLDGIGQYMCDYLHGLERRCSILWGGVDKLYFPCRLQAKAGETVTHYFLAVFDLHDKKIRVYDSMVKTKKPPADKVDHVKAYAVVLPHLFKYVNFGSLHDSLKNDKFNAAYKAHWVVSPNQLDRTSCGAFVIWYADLLTRGKSVDKVQPDQIHVYRERLGCQLWAHGRAKARDGFETPPEFVEHDYGQHNDDMCPL